MDKLSRAQDRTSNRQQGETKEVRHADANPVERVVEVAFISMDSYHTHSAGLLALSVSKGCGASMSVAACVEDGDALNARITCFVA